MKHLHENNKTLEKIMGRLAEDVYRIIKFTQSRLTQVQIIKLCSSHLKQYAEGDSNKQNISTNLPQKTGTVIAHPQVEYLKKQLRIQHDLSRKMFVQLNRDRLILSQSTLNFDQIRSDHLSFEVAQLSSADNCDNLVDSVPLISSVTAYSDLTKGIARKLQPKGISTAARSNKYFDSSTKVTEDEPQCRLSKRKTFSKLMKLESIVLSEASKKSLKRNNQIFLNKTEQENHVLEEENQNLRAIHQNLLSHLTLLEKFKHMPQLERLVEKQQFLNRKQSQLKQLEAYLCQRQLELNKNQAQGYRERVSLQFK